LNIDQIRPIWPAVLHAVTFRSRRQAKRLIREAGGHGSAAEVDAILRAIAHAPDSDAIQIAAARMEADPTGERQAAARLNEQIAQWAVGQADQQAVGQVVLWEFPAADHAAWLAAGMGDVSLDEYRQRLDHVETLLLAQGHRVRRCTASVAAMLDCLAAHGLANDAQGRAAAAAMLWSAQND
jgi:hypothetical protein